MNKELYVSSTPHETRVALTEDDQLAEVFFERENEYTLAGSIYKGRVTRVLPGMQSAFVDIGLERDAFLYVSDFLEMGEEEEEFDEIPAGRGTVDLRPRNSRRRHRRPRRSRKKRPRSKLPAKSLLRPTEMARPKTKAKPVQPPVKKANPAKVLVAGVVAGAVAAVAGDVKRSSRRAARLPPKRASGAI